MHPFLRSLLSLLCTMVLIVCLLAVVLPSASAAQGGTGFRRPLGFFFTFRDPASLFFPTASISLTLDNSTSFSAKPAAFGPPLPETGLTGRVWIGNGFQQRPSIGRKTSKMMKEGELGCDDVPGWRDAFWRERIGHRKSADHWHTQSTKTGVHLDKSSPDHRPDFIGSVQREEVFYQDKEPHRPQEPFNEQEWDRTRGLSGKIALLSRGGCGFSEKVEWAQRRGAVAVIVGDNVPGMPLIRMYPRGEVSHISIPSVFTSRTTAHLLASLIPTEDPEDEPAGSFGGHLPEPAPSSPVSDPPQPSETWPPGSDEPSETSPPTSAEPPEGLWVTLTLTDINASPFFNTLFVLVVSPLITLAVVYSMLLLRSRIRRRRWRAPKSVVERLPVRVYYTLSSRSSASNSETSSLHEVTQSTPLLPKVPTTTTTTISRPPLVRQSSPTLSSSYGSLEPPLGPLGEQEKAEAGLSYWRRKYGNKQKECVVCLDEYEDGISRVMSLPCGHEFHAECITPWLTTRRRTCPICKGDVVRSMSRMSTSAPAPQPPPEESEEEIQAQAAQLINPSPSAALPVPLVLDESAEPDAPQDLSSWSSLLSPPSWFSRGDNSTSRDTESGS